jgi:hypothetical protein
MVLVNSSCFIAKAKRKMFIGSRCVDTEVALEVMTFPCLKIGD